MDSTLTQKVSENLSPVANWQTRAGQREARFMTGVGEAGFVE